MHHDEEHVARVYRNIYNMAYESGWVASGQVLPKGASNGECYAGIS
jgi:hypothetical protein